MSGLTKNESKPAVERALLVLGAGVAGDGGEHDRRRPSASRASARPGESRPFPAGRCRTGRSAGAPARRCRALPRRSRGADLGAPELHLQAQALERVGVVLDDEDAVALAQPRHVAVGGVGVSSGSISGSQSTNSLPWPGPSLKPSTSPPCSWAMRRASVRPTPRPPRRARERLVLLREQLEGVRQELGVDPFARVLDRDLHRLRGAPDADRHRARLEAELGGVDDEVRERLREPAAVAADEQALVGNVDVEPVAALVQLVVAARDGRLDDALDRHLLANQRDLALRGAGDVDQLLDQVAEPADLALEDLAQADQDRVGALERAQHARRVGDRRERVAQLVREHGEELALAALGEAQLLGALGERFLELLPLVDVDAAADVADRRAVAAEARHAGVEHPAVAAVVAAQAQVHRERRARVEAGGADAEAAVEVLGMDEARPAVAAQLVDAAAAERRPRGAEPVVDAIERRRPRSGPARLRSSARIPRPPPVESGSRLDAVSLRFACHGQPWLPVASTLRNSALGRGNRHAAGAGSALRPPRRAAAAGEATPPLDRGDLEKLAVLGDRAARDLQALAHEQAGDLRVGERVGRVLGVDHSLDHAADRGRRAGARRSPSPSRARRST